MMRTFLNVSVATALLASSFSAAAAPYSFASDYQAPAGATATVNFTVPLGAVPYKARKASYGLTLGYGQRLDSVTSTGRIATRQTKFADVRFTGAFKLKRAEVATFDLANLDQDPRLNMGPHGGKENTWLWVGGAIVLGLGICWAAGCFDGDDDDEDELTSP